jgi:hypothetical protein
VLDGVQQRRNEEKHRYYASALANSLVPERPDAVDREKMLEVLNELGGSHLRMIAIYMTIEIPDSMLPLNGNMEHRVVHGSLPELTHEQVVERLGGVYIDRSGRSFVAPICPLKPTKPPRLPVVGVAFICLPGGALGAGCHSVGHRPGERTGPNACASSAPSRLYAGR